MGLPYSSSGMVLMYSQGVESTDKGKEGGARMENATTKCQMAYIQAQRGLSTIIYIMTAAYLPITSKACYVGAY